jgi:GT2 family glycosyltransferase
MEPKSKMELKPNSVGALVVTYNRLGLLKHLIDSLLAQTRPIDHIYVVDNASTDGTAEYLSTLKSPNISVHRLPTNTGGAGGFSFGMKWVFDEGHEWIWMMDDDVVQTSSCLCELLKHAQESPVLIPLLIQDDGTHLTGLAMKLNLASVLKLGFRLRIANRVYPTVDKMPSTVLVEDCGFEGPLLHRSIPQKIGFPRADFFIGNDDTEFAIRLLHSGLGQPMIVRDAHMKKPVFPHTSHPLWRSYYQWRNDLIIRSSLSAPPLMRFRVRLMYMLRTLFGYLLWERSLVKTRVRIHAFFDSLPGRTLTNRYLPG